MRDTVRTWVDENLIPVIGEAYIEGKFPKQLIPGMAELGLFGANLPEEYGCAGLNNVAYGLIMQELERGDSGIRSFASVQGALVMYPIYAFGSDEQKKQWLPLLAVGPGDRLLRADRAGLRLQPRRHDHHRPRDQGRLGAQRHQDVDHQRLAGDGLHHLGQDRRRQRSQVDPRLHRADRHQGLRGQGPEGEALAPRLRHERDPSRRTCTCPKDAILPKSGGLKSPLMCLTQARYGIAWGAIGAAMACYDEALRYAEQPGDVRQADRRHPDPAGAPGRHADRDHQGAVHDPAARPAQGRGHHDAGAGVALQAQQREHAPATSPARRAGCSAPTASWSSTTRCGTWRTWSRCTPTRAPTTCIR